MVLGSAIAGSVLFSPLLAEATASAAFTNALAEAAAPADAVAAFYLARGFAPIWTGPEDATRRAALIAALRDAGAHGLPAARYGVDALVAAAQSAVTEGDRGRLEAAMTDAFLSYARDLHSGATTPAKVDEGILREITRPDPAALLAGITAATDPSVFLHDLAPDMPEYARLMKEKIALEQVLAAQSSGNALTDASDVVALRDRLVQLGYLPQSSATAVMDGTITRAIQRFQIDSGLNADGSATESTIAALNTSNQDRLKSVIVAMERLRWMADLEFGSRHVWVNQPDFTAKIVDDGQTVFQTRAVIGKNVPEQRSPEFSDEMEYMVINPSWGVPRSIIVKEYLPLLRKNRNAVGHLDVIDGNGRIIPRGSVNFAAYSEKSFPFGLRQKPSDGNALGKVKFIFPNENNIYLHDTPAKNLFAHETRAYSHGCIRLGDPMDFAYSLLARQSSDPQGEFEGHLSSGQETNVSLKETVPVHLVYFTAYPDDRGDIAYRADVYGRDGRIFDALVEAGLALDGIAE